MKRLAIATIALAAIGITTAASADPAANMPAPAQSATKPPMKDAPATPKEPVWFEHMDTNGDHVISRQEYLDAMGRRFDRLDANHDGNVDMQEWQRVRKQMERMLRARRQAMQHAVNGGETPPPAASDQGPDDESDSPPRN